MKGYSCAFILHRRSKDDELAHLVCRVRWGSGRRSEVSLNLGYMVEPDKWEPKTQMCLPRSTHGRMKLPAQAINEEVSRFRDVVAAVMNAAEEEAPVALIREKLRTALGIDAPVKVGTAATWCEFVSTEQTNRAWSAGTLRTLGSFRQHLVAFEPFAAMDGFTEDNLYSFVEFLRNERGLKDTTVQKQLGFLHWFLAWSHEHGKLTDTSYQKFHPKFRKPGKPVVFLTWDELMKVWEYDPSGHPYYRDVLDVFLFCCFTSLRFSDAQNLRWSDIAGDHLSLVTVKTYDPIVIELNEWSNEILSRHIDEDNGGGRVFPRIPNPVMNRYIKKIMKDCGIDAPVHLTEFRGSSRSDRTCQKWELIGSHTGRRTFICNALMMGISPVVVMQWTGHSDMKAMAPYISIADEARKEAMTLFNLRR